MHIMLSATNIKKKNPAEYEYPTPEQSENALIKQNNTVSTIQSNTDK